MIAQYKNLTRRKYLWKVFEIIDCMQMNKDNTTTKREKELMIEFLCLPKDYAKFRFSTQGKKKVKKNFENRYNINWTNQNLNNKLYSLIRKGLLWRDSEEQIKFKPYISESANKIDKNLLSGKHFDLTFRFKLTADGVKNYTRFSRENSEEVKN